MKETLEWTIILMPVIVLGWIVVSIIKSSYKNYAEAKDKELARPDGIKEYICVKCGNQTNHPIRNGRPLAAGCLLGFIAIVTFFTIIIPIIVAMIDRSLYDKAKKKAVCPNCGGEDCLIPTDSPMARKILSSMNDER